MKRKFHLMVLGLLLTSSTLFAFDKPPKEAPPPQPIERQGNSPHPGFSWKAGYYKWTGTHYRWAQGHWVNPPRPGGVWVPGRWVKHEDHWEYQDGHWQY